MLKNKGWFIWAFWNCQTLNLEMQDFETKFESTSVRVAPVSEASVLGNLIAHNLFLMLHGILFKLKADRQMDGGKFNTLPSSLYEVVDKDLRWSSRDLTGLQISRWSEWMPSPVWLNFGQAYRAALRSSRPYVLTLRPLLAAKNLLPPISLTVLTLTPKNILEMPGGPP